MLMCRSLALPKGEQSLARGICMDESSRWESRSGGVMFASRPQSLQRSPLLVVSVDLER